MALQHKFFQHCLGMNCSSHAQQSNIVLSAVDYPERQWLMPSTTFGMSPYTASSLGTQGREGAGPELHTAASGRKTMVLPQNWSRASQSENLINYNTKHCFDAFTFTKHWVNTN